MEKRVYEEMRKRRQNGGGGRYEVNRAYKQTEKDNTMLGRIRNQRGFTLVEVIVVAVIVAVLAAVAIPLYNGYVTSSKQNVVDNAAGAAATFCAASKNSGTPPTINAETKVISGAQGSTMSFPKGVTFTFVGTDSVKAAYDGSTPEISAVQKF